MNQNLKALKDLLRSQCNLIDWSPTDSQLEAIEKELSQDLKAGKKISRSHCQLVVIKHCGPTEMFTMDSVDNSDLNTLLALATKNG